jgi:hypothetical protein
MKLMHSTVARDAVGPDLRQHAPRTAMKIIVQQLRHEIRIAAQSACVCGGIRLVAESMTTNPLRVTGVITCAECGASEEVAYQEAL